MGSCACGATVQPELEQRDQRHGFFYGSPKHPMKLTIPAGYYETIDDITTFIVQNAEIKGFLHFKFSSLNGKIVVHITQPNTWNPEQDVIEVVWMDNDLCRLLGMGPGNFKGEGSHKSLHVIPYKVPDPDLFIYSDIAAPAIVGDAHVPLLRIVSPSGKHGDRITKTYDRLHYVPVRVVNFDTIEVNISGDGGNFVHFQFGRSVVKLHFRPRKLSYL